MSEIMQWLMIIGAEVLGLIFVLLLVYWIRHSGKARKDAKAVDDLVAKTLAAKTQREEEISHFLSQQMGMQDNALKKASKKILREEMRLIQEFANLYKHRDASAAAQFQINYEQSVSPYFDLQGGASAPVSSEAQDTGDIDALRKENARLSEELKVTMDTMSRMLEEYSTMFSGGMPEDVAPPSETPMESDELADLIEAEEDVALEQVAEEIEEAAEVPEVAVTEEEVGDDLDDLFDTDNLDELLVGDEDSDKVAI